MIIRNKQGELLDYAVHEAEQKKSDGLVVIGHGVTGDKDRDLMVELASAIAKGGYDALRFSYAGNGESEGEFSAVTISKEVEDLHSLLDQMKGIRKIAYVGYSMGGAVGALASAKDDRINVLISLAGMVQTKKFCETEFGEEIPDQGCMWDDESHPLSQAFVDDLTNINTVLPAVKDVRIPWLMLHGSEDDVVLPEDSELLYAQQKGEKKHVELAGADHSFEGHWETLADEINAWLERFLK